MMRLRFAAMVLALAGLTAVFTPGYASADEAAQQGRAVFDAVKGSVITIEAVISVSYGQEEQEDKQEANATVISADGLAVLSLSAIDPASIIQSLGDSAKDVTTKLVSLKMVFAEGNEAPADVVLRDKDLDLAFVRPTAKAAQPLACVSLDSAASAALLDPVVVIGQLGAVAQRSHVAFIDRVEGLVEKPRKFFILGEHRARQVVCSPVFTMDGKFVGIGVMRAVKTDSSAMGDNVLVVVVPGEQIKELVAQVPARPE
jgi:S1-C subfamily serine protease